MSELLPEHPKEKVRSDLEGIPQDVETEVFRVNLIVLKHQIAIKCVRFHNQNPPPTNKQIYGVMPLGGISSLQEESVLIFSEPRCSCTALWDLSPVLPLSCIR